MSISDGLRKIRLARCTNYKGDGEWDAGEIVASPNGLFVGSLQSALDVENLIKHNITHVLTPAAKLKLWKENPGVQHFQIDIADHPAASLFKIMPQCLEFLDNCFAQENTNCLVHCASGVSRSVGICMAYLMLRKNLSFDEALAKIRVNRRRGNPNAGFKTQLITLQEYNGDIKKAEEIYKETFKTKGVMQVIIEQRTVANDIHAKVDEIENELKSGKGSVDQYARWLGSLKEMKTQAESENEKCSSGIMGDRPASMIRKSALSKIVRLMEDCEMKLASEEKED